MVYFFSALYWIVLLIGMLIHFPIASFIWLITTPFDRNRYFFHTISTWWMNTFLNLIFIWKLDIVGREKLKKNHAYVMISNHQSMVDISILFKLNFRFKWVSKAEVFKIPLWGWLMRMCNYIALQRGGARSMAKMMARCREELNKGCSVIIFPEGTRSKDGEIHRFKDGAFRLALDTQKDILPILIEGSYDAKPSRGWILDKKVRMVIKVLDPVPYEAISEKSPRGIAEYVREVMVGELNKIRQERKNA